MACALEFHLPPLVARVRRWSGFQEQTVAQQNCYLHLHKSDKMKPNRDLTSKTEETKEEWLCQALAFIDGVSCLVVLLRTDPLETLNWFTAGDSRQSCTVWMRELLKLVTVRSLVISDEPWRTLPERVSGRRSLFRIRLGVSCDLRLALGRCAWNGRLTGKSTDKN